MLDSNSKKLINALNALVNCLDFEDLKKFTSNEIPVFFPKTSGAIYLFDNSRELKKLCFWGRNYLINHVKEHDNLSIPLQAHNEDLGMFFIKPKLADPLAVNLLESLVKMISLTVANINYRTNNLIVDNTTGLYNELYLNLTLPRELSRAQRKALPLAVLMVQLDDEDSKNNLRNLATTFKKYLRKEDIATRIGENTLVLVVPDIEIENIVRRSSEIIKALIKNNKHISNTAMGISLFPLHGETQEELLNAAACALEAAKESSSSKIMVYKKL